LLPHRLTAAELDALEAAHPEGQVTRLVRYARELRGLLRRLHPHVEALEPRELHDTFDREVASIPVEEHNAEPRN